MNCNEYIESIYLNKDFNNLISKMNPIDLQNDLKHETIMILFEMDCNKIIELSNRNELLKYTYGIVWKIVNSKRSTFYKNFRQNNHKQMIEYLHTFDGKEIPQSLGMVANKLLQEKLNMNPYDAHESMIFTKYVELKSYQKVSDYFGIPFRHVYNVVNKTRKELKTKLKKQ